MNTRLVGWALALFPLATTLAASEAKKTDAQSDGLVGPVRSISTRQETQQIEWGQKDAHIGIWGIAAVSAITEMAPSFLEDVLIRLTKTSYAGAAIIGLRKVDTPKAWDVLARLATDADDASIRIAAIENLGRTNGKVHLPVLFQLMHSKEKDVQRAAASSAGELGRAASVAPLAALLSDDDPEVRRAGGGGLGNTHAAEAVPLLIALLLDSDANVRQTAVGSLYLLTHRAALDPARWLDMATMQEAVIAHGKWMRWWAAHADRSEMHSIGDCGPPEGID